MCYRSTQEVKTMVIGGIIGAIVAYILVASSTEGPKFPGDKSFNRRGPGCFASLLGLCLGIVIGAVIGMFAGLS